MYPFQLPLTTFNRHAQIQHFNISQNGRPQHANKIANTAGIEDHGRAWIPQIDLERVRKADARARER